MLKWETINQTDHEQTERANVPGGWLVMRKNGLHLPQSLCSWFVTDPAHSWDVTQD